MPEFQQIICGKNRRYFVERSWLMIGRDSETYTLYDGKTPILITDGIQYIVLLCNILNGYESRLKEANRKLGLMFDYFHAMPFSIEDVIPEIYDEEKW